MGEAKSLEYNVTDAAELIGEMETAAEIKAFIEGDERKGVLGAAEARTEKLAKVDDKPDGEPGSAGVEDPYAFEKPYATIIIPKGTDKQAEKTVTVRVQGTMPNGTPYAFNRVFRRGVSEHNVPANIRNTLNNLLITNYYSEEKPDRTGFELKSDVAPRWVFTIQDQYDVKKTDEEIRKELKL